MSITYRPPFDEDDDLDLRALYRKPRAGGSPELEAAVRRTWHPGRSWHPGWAAASCLAIVAGVFAWTDMRESAEMADMNAQLAVPHEVGTAAERAPAPRPMMAADTPAPQPAPAPAQRAAQAPADAQAQPAVQIAAPAPQAAEATEQAAAEQPAEAATAEVVAFSEQDIEARVAHIRSLMQDDQQDEAVAALRELQQGAPDLTLPDDLHELAQQNPAS
ncbi:hypothetical protein [Achromobacter sp. 79A6]|jgi:hypothetical protein|uniref:hypothetical protein n=1 Tax=unclassified Achromobacter TaxID=2626865 RepID=UPI0021F117B0